MDNEVIATTNEIRNKRCREDYAAKKDDINERHHKRKAEKKLASGVAYDLRFDRRRRTSFMEGISYDGGINQPAVYLETSGESSIDKVEEANCCKVGLFSRYGTCLLVKSTAVKSRKPTAAAYSVC